MPSAGFKHTGSTQVAHEALRTLSARGAISENGWHLVPGSIEGKAIWRRVRELIYIQYSQFATVLGCLRPLKAGTASFTRLSGHDLINNQVNTNVNTACIAAIGEALDCFGLLLKT